MVTGEREAGQRGKQKTSGPASPIGPLPPVTCIRPSQPPRLSPPSSPLPSTLPLRNSRFSEDSFSYEPFLPLPLPFHLLPFPIFTPSHLPLASFRHTATHLSQSTRPIRYFFCILTALRSVRVHRGTRASSILSISCIDTFPLLRRPPDPLHSIPTISALFLTKHAFRLATPSAVDSGPCPLPQHQYRSSSGGVRQSEPHRTLSTPSRSPEK